MNIDSDGQVNWYRVGSVDMLDEGRVTTVQAGHRAVCLTRTPAGYGAISNRCPHQGGPLGDGFLQNGYVVCPWHAWEYDPHTGASPPGYDDEAAESFVVEIRDDGVYVGVAEAPHPLTLMDQMVEVMIDWGVDTVFGMVGHSNLGLVNPNFAQFAESCGGLGIRVEKAGELRAALEKALGHDGPSIVEVISSAGQL